MIERRELMLALGLHALGSPWAARAQQAARALLIGWLSGSSPETAGYLADVFKKRLGELGFVEGRDVVYEHRFARGKPELFAQLARELVALKPDVILATGGLASVLAVQEATRSIPIAALALSDPVASGLAKSLARPGGNVTGLADLGYDTAPKRLELLQAVVPRLNRVAVLWSSADRAPGFLKSLQAAAQTVGVEVVVVEVAVPSDIDSAFARMVRQQVGGAFAVGTALSFGLRREVADAALRHRMPTMFGVRASVDAGGLMSYGVDLVDVERRLAGYVARILKGEKPGDLPIEQPTKLELVINSRTAKALGITIPQTVLLRADELIE